ncbi:hypothetical protein QLG20_13460 [Klebsiella variicola]|nr:hypothetical protein [Klebsiella variicola]MBG2638116.1 hypothetical protein [Klebsiella michiganensis]BAS40747.1 rhamnulokinase [Klebsiella oxytoca]HBZ1374117.1 hypothetical protein [Klebsiella pneumoniae]MBG2685391.1 hypothetical protein [Klebsiella michiganensis]WHE65257.1 hypothetical protein QLG20_13460 [Klebsiella variicola]
MNTYGLDAYAMNMHAPLFADKFAKGFQWKNERERTIFSVTVQKVLKITEQSEKFVNDFCNETGYDRNQLNQLMSEMFYKWDEYLSRLKK